MMQIRYSHERGNGKAYQITGEDVKRLNAQMERRLEWRRDKVVELYSEGRSQPEIAKILQIGLGTVDRDLQYRRRQSKNKVKVYLDEYLPFEHDICHVGLNKILRKVWDIINDKGSSEKAVSQALSLAKECYKFKQELLADKTIIDKAIEFVRSHQLKQSEVETEIENEWRQHALQDSARSEAVF